VIAERGGGARAKEIRTVAGPGVTSTSGALELAVVDGIVEREPTHTVDDSAMNERLGEIGQQEGHGNKCHSEYKENKSSLQVPHWG